MSGPCLWLALLLTGCGQSGALYFPDAPGATPTPAPTVPAPAER